ncbi:MAG: PglZ domain-containing protein, partial [Clostridiaceae bacterium]
PEMSAYEVTDQLIEAMDQDYDMIILNYANCDMVGHTGVLSAAIKAVETVDTNMKRVIDKVLEKGGSVFVTADHGNCEQEIDYTTGEPFTSHTTNPVPLIYITNEPKKILNPGVLSDLAPTILEEMGLSKPQEMTAHSLLSELVEFK